jgi:hypothetical protein
MEESKQLPVNEGMAADGACVCNGAALSHAQAANILKF